MAEQSGSIRRTLRGLSILHICTMSEAGMVPPVTEKIARDNQRVIRKNLTVHGRLVSPTAPAMKNRPLATAKI